MNISSSITTNVNASYDHDFCSACGAIFPLPDGNSIVQCLLCKNTQDIAILNGTQFTVDVQFNQEMKRREIEKTVEGTLIDRKCPKCGNEQMFFTTRQLRSADEGQTVFYRCSNCSFLELENS